MNLLPSEYIRDSIESHLANNTTTSQKIYWVVLIAVFIVLGSLPFIDVNVSIQNMGVIRPITEKTEIKSSISELVDSVYVKEGQKINIGDTLLTFRANNSNLRINYLQKRIEDSRDHINDLQFLIHRERPSKFRSETRYQEYSFYLKQREELKSKLFKAEKDLQRNKVLFEKKVLSEEEFEHFQFEYTKGLNELASLRENQLSKWQSDLNGYLNSLEELQSILNQEIKTRDFSVVTSPVRGTLDQFRGIYNGSSMQVGSSLAIISPDSTLCADVYVSPRNIGYIHPGMPVKIQVESFNYNEWGMLSGKVTEISSDFLTDNVGGKAYYKVKCSLDRNYLVRGKTGVKGMIKKGMSVSSHFMITRKSLFELLYQRMDDWVNPTQYSNNN